MLTGPADARREVRTARRRSRADVRSTDPRIDELGPRSRRADVAAATAGVRDDAAARRRTPIRPAARRRRGRPRRHAGQRRLAAGRAGARATGAAVAIRRHGRRPDRPESGMPSRRRADRPARPAEPLGPAGAATADDGPTAAHSSVARVEPGAAARSRAAARRSGLSRLGALAGVLRPDRWLPAPPLDPLAAGMLVTAAPLIDIAPLERATMAGPGRRPVRQARRRDAQAHQARPARARDARRDGRDAPAHRARLRASASTSTGCRRTSRRSSRCSRRPTRSASSRSRAGPRCRRCRSRGRRASTTSSSRSRSSGRARSRATPSTRTCAASRASSR